MVDFAGWLMPVNYGSQIAEHTAVRSDAGMFDVSHMTIIDVHGDQAEAFLQRLIANDVARLNINQALYGALLNERAGVLDDLIVYRLAWGFRCVVNASTRDKVLAWMQQHTRADAHFEHKPQIMIAVQGPNAVQRLLQVEAVSGLAELTPFYAMQHGDWLIGRTGYTGEDGVEIMLPEAQGVELWRKLREVGVAPAGLGARDTLRLEGGLNLYGQDLDEATSPLASNIGWTIAWEPQERDFIGRQALTELRETNTQKLIGLIMRDKGILRHGQAVHTNAGAGVITSGTYSPTLAYSIALARVPKQATGECEVDIRGTRKKAVLCKPPFVRNGTAMHP
ncbi:MAG: glycine cleavage system protein T [Gammaproteobacteria bacterium]|nr:glycine cleavage system protein T [Gammaproteobacteria bacterium]